MTAPTPIDPQLSGCVIVTGMPGAGKSTITSLVGQRLQKAAQVSGDVMNMMIRSGYVGFMAKPAEESISQDELCNRNLCSVANNFIDFGFVALMDTVLADRAELDFFLALLSPRRVRLVVLAPGIEVCRHRNVTRDPDDFFDFDGYERLEADMEREFGGVGWWFDTADLGPEETADRIVAELAARCPPLEAGWHDWLRRLHGV